MSDQPAHGTHDYADDPRNDAVLVYVNGELNPREQAVVSVFDAGTFAGLVPVREVDGRTLGDSGGDRPLTARLRELYAVAVADDVAAAESAGPARTS